MPNKKILIILTIFSLLVTNPNYAKTAPSCHSQFIKMSREYAIPLSSITVALIISSWINFGIYALIYGNEKSPNDKDSIFNPFSPSFKTYNINDDLIENEVITELTVIVEKLRNIQPTQAQLYFGNFQLTKKVLEFIANNSDVFQKHHFTIILQINNNAIFDEQIFINIRSYIKMHDFVVRFNINKAEINYPAYIKFLTNLADNSLLPNDYTFVLKQFF